jgi:hypothetical protein
VDEGLQALCTVLADGGFSPETTCDTVLRAMLDRQPADDIALLVARTQALDTGSVAIWDLPDDPAVVGHARAQVSDQLRTWGLGELAFVTELVASELVTNAIRYAAPPIQLRLIAGRSLICEVSDASSTSPHLRRARMMDEGGRGLMMVAQLSEAWGTRYTSTGKTIWTEQTIDHRTP